MQDDDDEVMGKLGQAKALAQRYLELIGKPLRITGEVAEIEVTRLLGIELVEARQALCCLSSWMRASRQPPSGRGNRTSHHGVA